MTAAVDGLSAPRPARALAAPPWASPALAAGGLTLLALTAHVMLWGLSAPLGRAPVAGLAVELAGLAWALAAWWSLRRAAADGVARGAAAVFVDHGPFAFGRHPMYLGTVVAMAGIGLGLGAPFMGAAAASFAVLMSQVQIPFEEAQLRRAFGGWYSDYAASVRRWL